MSYFVAPMEQTSGGMGVRLCQIETIGMRTLAAVSFLRLRQPYAGEQFLETSVGADRIGQRIDCHVNQTVIALPERLIKPSECSIFLTETYIHDGKVDSWHVSPLREVLQVREHSLRLGPIAGNSQCVAISHQHRRIIYHHFAQLGKACNGLRIHSLLTLRGGKPKACV